MSRSAYIHALGTTRDLKFISRRHALRIIRFAFYCAFGLAIATNIIILSLLIDWQGVAESAGLGSLFQ